MYGTIKAKVHGMKSKVGKGHAKLSALMVSLILSTFGSAHATYLDNVTALIGELPDLIDAIADLAPPLARLIMTLAVIGLVVGIFGAIVYGIKKMLSKGWA